MRRLGAKGRAAVLASLAAATVGTVAGSAEGLHPLAARVVALREAREAAARMPADLVMDPAAIEAVARTGLLVLGILALPAPPAPAETVWDHIAFCETAGNWQMHGPRFSGGLGFYNGTWVTFGGLEFAPHAGLATREQQIVVAERIRATYGGYSQSWGCARRLGIP